MATAKYGVCGVCQTKQLVVQIPSPRQGPPYGPERNWIMVPHVITGTNTMCNGGGTNPLELVE